MLNTDGEMTWGPDAELTDAGVQQAKKTSDLWKGEFAEGMPLPTQLLCSPFTRTADTCKITFGDMMIGPGKVRPLIIEGSLTESTESVHMIDDVSRLIRCFTRRSVYVLEISEGLGPIFREDSPILFWRTQ
ncbi:hypothetical protein FRB94_003699 [Tulasnella sp. JGI-2019a]|nr:hypothetical protein FRB94_003699 [Tulasnella sp. JGI-2019a]